MEAYLWIFRFIYLNRSTVRICSKLEEHLQLVEIVPFDGVNEPGTQLVGDEMATNYVKKLIVVRY